MISKGKQRSTEEHIVNLIANSFFDDMYDWVHQDSINCYAFAIGLTFPDPHHQFYTPGKIYNMKFGQGAFVKNEIDAQFIHECIMRDTIALHQNCERLSFNALTEDDGNFYFAITLFHMNSQPYDKHWHFICRTPSGLWLHKPNWFQSVQEINWVTYGQTFKFETLAIETGCDMQNTFGNVLVPCEGVCLENYFYKLEVPKD